METDFTRLMGCRLPVQLAGMGGMATPALVAAVANAGGLGMAGAAAMPTAQLEQQLDETLAFCSPGVKIGVNFLMPFVTQEPVEMAVAKVDVVEFFYDQPDAQLVACAHQASALVGWQVGSAAEADAAVAAGCDYIIAQGVEAGGHVRGTQPLMDLLASITARLKIPILGAGGVSDGEGLARVLAAGGHGIRVGTRFVAAMESAAHPEYVAALLQADETSTELTEAYGVGWPEAPHRVLRSCLEAAAADERANVGLMTLGNTTVEIPKFNVMPPDKTATGNVAAMCM